jgi:hypothetical protein
MANAMIARDCQIDIGIRQDGHRQCDYGTFHHWGIGIEHELQGGHVKDFGGAVSRRIGSIGIRGISRSICGIGGWSTAGFMGRLGRFFGFRLGCFFGGIVRVLKEELNRIEMNENENRDALERSTDSRNQYRLPSTVILTACGACAGAGPPPFPPFPPCCSFCCFFFSALLIGAWNGFPSTPIPLFCSAYNCFLANNSLTAIPVSSFLSLAVFKSLIFDPSASISTFSCSKDAAILSVFFY